MIIGVLSDSHGRADITARAVRALLVHGAEMLIHLGDIGGESVIDELAGHHARIVFGNCDDDEATLGRYAELAGLVVDHPMGIIEIDGKRVAFTHGHLDRCLRQAIGEGVDYLLLGHSHVAADERQGKTRIVNPGALFRAARYTSALLEPARDALQFIEISKAPEPRHDR